MKKHILNEQNIILVENPKNLEELLKKDYWHKIPSASLVRVKILNNPVSGSNFRLDYLENNKHKRAEFGIDLYYNKIEKYFCIKPYDTSNYSDIFLYKKLTPNYIKYLTDKDIFLVTYNDIINWEKTF